MGCRSRSADRALRARFVCSVTGAHVATRFCDHAIAIGGGEAHAGRAEQVLTEDALSALYGRPLVRLASGALSTFVPR